MDVETYMFLGHVASKIVAGEAPYPKRDGSFKFDTIWSWRYEPFFIKFQKPAPDGRRGVMGKRKFQTIDWVWDGTKWIDEQEFLQRFGKRDLGGEVQVYDGKDWMTESQFNSKYGDKVKEKPRWKAEPTPKAEFRDKTEDAMREFEEKGGKVDRHVPSETKEHTYERTPKGPAPRHKDFFSSAARKIAQSSASIFSRNF